jgi:sporulation protein YlmC with PRC-barrel domain
LASLLSITRDMRRDPVWPGRTNEAHGHKRNFPPQKSSSFVRLDCSERGNYAKEEIHLTKKRREIAMVHTLVPSDRVEAATVYDRDGDKIGTIERLMLEKMTGTVAYAVVKCSGFLGTDQHHYPVPWSSLRYNLARKSYEITLTLEDLRSGPSELDGIDWGDRSPVYRQPQYWTV